MADDALRNGVMDMLLKKKALPSKSVLENTLKGSVQEAEAEESVPEKKVDKLVEQLADYAHNAWSGWMEYLFEKCTVNKDGSMVIPKDLVDRWMMQLGTNYEELSEEMKESDRKEARKMLEIVGRKTVVQKSKESPRKDMSKALGEVIENQSKPGIENLEVDVIEDSIRTMLGKGVRKEIFEAMFR